ncbi:MAG: hypothetical protein AAF702_44360 [Chloroflexota bacterium]
MSRHNGTDYIAGIAFSIFFMFALIYLAIIAVVLVTALLAALVIGWYLSYILLKGLDTALEETLFTEYSGLVPLIAAIFWAAIATIVIPQQWVYSLGDIWPALIHYPQITPMIGGVLGLCWGGLVLYSEWQSDDEVDPLDLSGMYQLGQQDIISPDEEMQSLLADSVVLGADDDSWLR